MYSLTSTHTIEVLVAGKPITTYAHKGDTYVEGRPGSEYKIRIKNHVNYRVKAIVSVDGISVIDGELASEHSQGYIIGAHDEIVIDGWRVDDHTVRKFLFGDRKGSYSNKTGNGTTNVGVIGAIVTREKNDYGIRHLYQAPNFFRSQTPVGQWNDWTYQHDQYPMVMFGAVEKGVTHDCYNAQATRSSVNTVAGAAPVAMASLSLNNLGTAMGEEKKSSVHEVKFYADQSTAITSMIFYDDRKGLEARGIIVDPRKARPNPFPASKKYCKIV